MKNASLAALAFALMAAPAMANPFLVPEIDALSGTAALAAVAGVVMLVRERMKR